MSFDGRNVWNRIKELVSERHELLNENNTLPRTLEGRIVRDENNRRIREIEHDLDTLRTVYAIG